MYVFVCIRRYMHILITYHASFWLLQRICVHVLPTNPIPVLNVDGTEKLDLHVHFRHMFQTQKRLLKVFSAELPVQNRWKQEVGVEQSNPGDNRPQSERAFAEDNSVWEKG